MVKRIFWKQTIVEQAELSGFLTTMNFQVNKFVLMALPDDKVLIVYIDREIKNVE